MRRIRAGRVAGIQIAASSGCKVTARRGYICNVKNRTMARIEVNLAQPEFGFDATDQSGKMMHMDTNPEGGGHDYGVRPMQALLMAMGGCSGIDIVSILKKMRQPYTSLRMVIDGEPRAGKGACALGESAYRVSYFRRCGQGKSVARGVAFH